MQTFTAFFGGAFLGGEFFSYTPNVGGGRTGGSTANVYLRGRKRTSTEILLDRRRFGLDEHLNEILTRWGRPKK